mgnify:CR=1 FL=1
MSLLASVQIGCLIAFAALLLAAATSLVTAQQQAFDDVQAFAAVVLAQVVAQAVHGGLGFVFGGEGLDAAPQRDGFVIGRHDPEVPLRVLRLALALADDADVSPAQPLHVPLSIVGLPGETGDKLPGATRTGPTVPVKYAKAGITPTAIGGKYRMKRARLCGS